MRIVNAQYIHDARNPLQQRPRGIDNDSCFHAEIMETMVPVEIVEAVVLTPRGCSA